jgi:hypothetical protein
VLGLDGIQRASSSRIGPRASARSSRLTTIGLSRRFLAGSNAAADNYRIGHARSLFTAGFLGRGFDSRRLHQINTSRAHFLAWAFRSGLLPEDLPTPVQEIVNAFNNRFTLEIFFDRALKEGMIGPNPTLGEIQSCWGGLSEKQREHYRYKPSGVLIEELSRFRNDMAHPESWNLVTVPRSPLSAYELLIDIVARLWP